MPLLSSSDHSEFGREGMRCKKRARVEHCAEIVLVVENTILGNYLHQKRAVLIEKHSGKARTLRDEDSVLLLVGSPMMQGPVKSSAGSIFETQFAYQGCCMYSLVLFDQNTSTLSNPKGLCKARGELTDFSAHAQNQAQALGRRLRWIRASSQQLQQQRCDIQRNA